MADSKGDVTVSLSAERIVAYALLLLAVGSAYAKIQGDVNFLKEQSVENKAWREQVDTQLYQLRIYERANELRDGKRNAVPPGD